MTTAYKWKCPYDCPTTKGPYYDRTILRNAASEHIRTQHADTLPPMRDGHRADARMRHATNPIPGYDPRGA